MSTQQQIQAWQQAIDQKQQEKAGQETILKVQREQLDKAQNASADADLALDRARKSGASAEQIESLQRQVRQAGQAETDARIAVDKTETNIGSLNGSIRFNTAQRDLYQGSLPAQGNPSSTVADQTDNARSDAAQIAPAPQPVQPAAGPVDQPQTTVDEFGNTVAVDNPAAVDDPFETARLAREAEGDGPTLAAPAPVDDFVRDPVTGEFVPSDSVQAEQILAERAAAEEQVAVTGPAPVPTAVTVIQDENGAWGVWNDQDGAFITTGLTQQEAELQAEEIRAGFGVQQRPAPTGSTGLTPEEQLAKDQAAAKANAINQATLQSRYKQAGSSDWRVRLQLAPTSNYLYNANPPGILKPLAATNGVVFPYTPQINTSYKANYEQYDLVHSNYRGVYYKNSRVDDLQIRATFTAQDTREADYLLAVIHFFRSVTKMFYGKDAERGSPPPLVFLSGFGMNQFYGHPCVVSTFQYNLPDNVDYIRATNYNNYGTDLLSRRTASAASNGPGVGSVTRKAISGLTGFGDPRPAPDSVVSSVNNTQLANYVPTKMEIDITLIPVQTRSQVSKQFSLKGFANGDLIKGGFW